jgi:hypothetical protein
MAGRAGSVEFRAFFPGSLSSLPQPVQALLRAHLGLSQSWQWPASPLAAARRTDAYLLTGHCRLGLKLRAVDPSAAAAAPAPLELKIATLVHPDGSEVLQKHELAPSSSSFAEVELPLSALERAALSAAAARPPLAGRTLVAKQRQVGAQASELTDLLLTPAGGGGGAAPQPWCTWCFEEKGWGGSGGADAGPRARGAALLLALQQAAPPGTPEWRVCSYAGWLEAACAAPLPPGAAQPPPQPPLPAPAEGGSK